LDADIELNAVDYSWGDLVGQPDRTTASTIDFQNALTHELGHVVGLAHNCFAAGDSSVRLFDNTGAPEVDCYSNPPPPALVTEATMYPSILLSDTQRRTLTADDQQGVCDIYPHQHDVCPPRPVDAGVDASASTVDLGGGVAAASPVSGCSCSVLAPSDPDGSRTTPLWVIIGVALAALIILRRHRRICIGRHLAFQGGNERRHGLSRKRT
jgi:hypothetical protein